MKTPSDALVSHGALLAAGAQVGAGDFDGDGRTDLFFFNSTTRTWVLALDRANGQFEHISGPWSWGHGWSSVGRP